jgi:hypothetical protein
MRGRKLSQAEALEEYALYRIRLFEYLDIFQVVADIMDGRYSPKTDLGHGPKQFISALKTFLTGLFASLIDQNRRAINVFDVWVALFPQNEDRILAVWREIEPLEDLIKDYRNKVAFHVENKIGAYLRTRSQFYRYRKEIASAMQAFFGLSAELMKAEPNNLPGFRGELDGVLRREFPDETNENIEKLIDYVIEGKPED